MFFDPGVIGLKDIKGEVESTYDSISPFFHEHRKRLWPPMASFIEEVSPCKLIDIGCGTGRIILEGIKRDCSVTGVDISTGQLETARSYLKEHGSLEGFHLVKADMEDLPLPDDTFDASTMIASLHHLPDRISRVRALVEAKRVLKPGGRILISVWTWDQDRFREHHLSRIGGERELDDLDGPEPGDHMVPWKDGELRYRFYHLYGPGELENEILSSTLTLTRSYFDGKNHWAEAFNDQKNSR